MRKFETLKMYAELAWAGYRGFLKPDDKGKLETTSAQRDNFSKNFYKDVNMARFLIPATLVLLFAINPQANAYELTSQNVPIVLKKMIEEAKTSEVSYGNKYYFDGEELSDPRVNPFKTKDEIEAQIKISIEQNATFQNRLKKLSEKYGNFCKDFYSDLKKYKNIEIIEPVADKVPYHHDTFKKTMGACYYMGMDWYIERFDIRGRQYDPKITSLIKPMYYSLWEVDFMGDDNLLLVQWYEQDRSKNGKRKASAAYILNKEQCQKAISANHAFRILEDRRIKRKNDWFNMVENDKDNWWIIRYKKRNYILETKKITDVIVILYSNIDTGIGMGDDSDYSRIKCRRKFFLMND